MAVMTILGDPGLASWGKNSGDLMGVGLSELAMTCTAF